LIVSALRLGPGSLEEKRGRDLAHNRGPGAVSLRLRHFACAKDSSSPGRQLTISVPSRNDPDNLLVAMLIGASVFSLVALAVSLLWH